MTSLRHKFWLGFGGQLAILLTVSTLAVLGLTSYSHSLEKVFHENYDSAVFCDGMKSSLDQLLARAQRLVSNEPLAREIDPAQQEASFQQFFSYQNANCTLPGEREKTDRLGTLWTQFKPLYNRFDVAANHNFEVYRQQILPKVQEMRQLAQQIADMNMNNMASVDGQIKHTLVRLRDAMILLAVSGVIVASIVVYTVGHSIFSQLGALTKSARRIEAGDLDLSLPVKSADEIGQLAAAFNAMAAKLREYRKQDRDRLARTQATTQLAIDSLTDAVFVISPDDVIEIANRSARAHFAAEPGSPVAQLGLKWLTLLCENIKLQKKPIEPQGYAAAVQLFEDGEERFLLPRAVPMLDSQQKLIGITVILVDITRLRRADEAKSNLISTVSHELRTPLTGLRMSLSLLGGGKFSEATEKRQLLINAAREDGDRLHRILDNLLNISRIESGRSQFQIRPMSSAQAIHSAVDPLRPGFAEKEIQLQVRASDELPFVQADPMGIGLALTNLLSNALKYTPTGGTVTIWNEPAESGRVCICVSDTGPGIPEDYRDRVFEKFFRVPIPTAPPGAGLGLAIARDIVEAHQGTLDFQCPPAGGTIFRMTLPTTPPRPAVDGELSGRA